MRRPGLLAVTLCSSFGIAARTPSTFGRHSLEPASPQGRCSGATLRCRSASPPLPCPHPSPRGSSRPRCSPSFRSASSRVASFSQRWSGAPACRCGPPPLVGESTLSNTLARPVNVPVWSSALLICRATDLRSTGPPLGAMEWAASTRRPDYARDRRTARMLGRNRATGPARRRFLAPQSHAEPHSRPSRCGGMDGRSRMVMPQPGVPLARHLTCNLGGGKKPGRAQRTCAIHEDR